MWGASKWDKQYITVAERHLTDSFGRSQETNFIPEGDIYRLAAKSELPAWTFEHPPECQLLNYRQSGGSCPAQFWAHPRFEVCGISRTLPVIWSAGKEAGTVCLPHVAITFRYPLAAQNCAVMTSPKLGASPQNWGGLLKVKESPGSFSFIFVVLLRYWVCHIFVLNLCCNFVSLLYSLCFTFCFTFASALLY